MVDEKHEPPPEAAPGDQVVAPSESGAVASLVAYLEDRVPPRYRVELFRALLPRVLARMPTGWPGPGGRGTFDPLPHPALARRTPPPESADVASLRQQLDLSPYASVLAAPGRTLLKAMVALDAAARQLDVSWMTPSEIERLLSERARVRSIYRTNISNALRSALDWVDRRRRGRAYEYRLTASGRARLRRQLDLAGP